MPEFRAVTLPSGLRVAAEVDRRGYSAAIGYFVHTGGRDEVDLESGVSHFLEHMMFKGSARRSAADVNRELDELGGQSNAYTSEEQTVYYATVLPKFQDRAVELLSDILSPALDEHEFDMERQVILEEIAKYEDQPPFGAFERAMEIYFGPRGVGRRVLGTAESIQAMTASVMRDYFNRRYRPERIVLAATGNVDFDSLVAMAEMHTATWSQRPSPNPLPADGGDRLPAGIAVDPVLDVPDASQAYLIRVSPGPSANDADRYATRLMATVVADEGGSRLFWELIDTGRAEVATMWPQEFSDTGAMFSYLACAPEDLASNRRLMDDVLMLCKEKGFERDEVQQAINKTVAGYIMQSERPSNQLFGLGSRWLYRNEYVSLDERLDRYRRLDENDLQQTAEKYLTLDTTEIIAAPEGEPTLSESR